ncbi:50S ribosomal protein L30 [Aerococcus suis]|uniref:Large ribosomal subunit protein uL30 n=1 Tax=Aerococcus suis TaxID=371602 RepID=A0A1W1Z3J6_9LACT|nr:50S ribosomal protein L30 [Aerococcus suis]MCI7240194.1 50S ribosomal protein L30 [Aerococcus suis]MDD7758836.1 50S ribosomal protein L30 [Aerococcus suis]MDY4646397.1 50S ribosomal protein L30 [Aerococcus suis]SMC42681.1 large subunit ribosomal protein L30 [Aerococcus suis]
MAEVKITLKRSVIGRPQDQIATIKALGITKTNRSVVKTRNEAIDGMLKKVAHLVEVTEA